MFEPILESLQHQTQIPIVLPTEIPTDAIVPFPAEQGGAQPYINVPITQGGHFQHISASIVDVDPAFYSVSLDAAPNCQGADACSFGELTGEQVYQDTPSIQAEYFEQNSFDYQPVGRSPESPGKVTLNRGIEGYFVQFVCGANCNFSKLIWQQNSYRYMAGIRMASQATVVNFANSIIENEIKP
ncbi:hypothetical protein [Microcoleus sp. FACHB-1515]|uniref:hypothetical protein n=1 Tax=Cyanophyceae TaxID=3028117 RepID=UPI0018F0250F|nr:hypothetical protein [Microcoleus sp. FACHB-1515]